MPVRSVCYQHITGKQSFSPEKWMQQALPNLHGVISKNTVTLIELSEDAAVHWGSDWTKRQHGWQSVRCVRQDFRLCRVNDRKGKPTSCTQIKPVTQSCSGIVKGQSKVLNPLAHSSANYTAGRIYATFTRRCQRNYNGKIFHDLWLFTAVRHLRSIGLISLNVSLNKSSQNGYTVACHCNAVLSDCIYWIGISATLNCASCKTKQNVH